MLDPIQVSDFSSRLIPSKQGEQHGRFTIPGLEKWFTDDVKSSFQSISRSLRKHPETAEAKPVIVKTSSLNRRAVNPSFDRNAIRANRFRSRKRMDQLPCSGDIHFLPPYSPHSTSLVGLCGYANIFTYNSRNVFGRNQGKGICEINALT